MEIGRKLIAGVLGGWVGGALIGLLEAVLITASGGCEEFGVFAFSVFCYGLIGAAMGAGWGVATSVLGFLGRDAESTLASAGGVAAGLLGLAVTRFRVVRDLFAESLPLFSGSGIAVHVALILGAVGVFFLVRRVLLRGGDSLGAEFAGGMWAVATVVIGVVVTFGLNAVARPTAPALPAVTAGGPNVVLILVDTLRADHIGPYGGTIVATPAIDRLAADSVVFENGFSHSSWTRPSVATVLTSLYPASHSVMFKTDLLPDDVVTVGENFETAGYRTSGFVTNINVAPSFNFEQGFQRYRYLSPDFFFGATDSGSKLSFYSVLRLIRERFLSSSKWAEQYYQDAETVTDNVLPWLEANSSESFFTFIHYMDPHDPYFEIPYNGNAIARVNNPHPDASEAEHLRELYAANIGYFDGFLETLLKKLEDAGVYDDTVIALIADHGEEFYEHDGWWHGTTLYEEQIHVPIIIKRASQAGAGTRITDLVGLIDVSPTLVAAADLSAPSAWQGRDLFGATIPPTALYAEEDHEGNELESVRTTDFKLIVANEGNPRGLEAVELYSLKSDPGETNNLAASMPDKVAELRGTMDALRTMAGTSAVSGESGEISDADKARLEALGYIE
ncbi:MAG: arylsulfatase A-like enzyme [Hyphomicrobiaceae bacterium]|jgi:arylsulfatase A-like enzyme